MYQPVSGMYAKIRTSGMHWVIWEITTIRDQDVFSGQWNGSDYYNLSEYKYNDSFWGFDEIWKQYYNIIKCANSAIEALDNYGQHCTTDAQKATNKAYIGEVKFMRAYAYFRLVQAFGAVTILRDNNQTDLTRSTVDAVYKYALEDLEYGMTYMPRIRPNQSEHKGAVTAFSAATLAAKIYLNQGNYQKVKELTNDIIEHGNFQLYPDYYQLWKIPGKLSVVHIRKAVAADHQPRCVFVDFHERSRASGAENGIRKSVVYQDSADLLGIFNFRHNYNDDAHDLFALSLFSPERSD